MATRGDGQSGRRDPLLWDDAKHHIPLTLPAPLTFPLIRGVMDRSSAPPEDISSDASQSFASAETSLRSWAPRAVGPLSTEPSNPRGTSRTAASWPPAANHRNVKESGRRTAAHDSSPRKQHHGIPTSGQSHGRQGVEFLEAQLSLAPNLPRGPEADLRPVPGIRFPARAMFGIAHFPWVRRQSVCALCRCAASRPRIPRVTAGPLGAMPAVGLGCIVSVSKDGAKG